MPRTGTRIRVIRLSGILILVASLVATLTFLFQYQNNLATRIKMEPADLVSIAYLRLLINMKPRDNTLRIELAKKLRDLGRWDEARETLEPILSHDGHINWPARLLSIGIQTGKIFAMNENDPLRQNLIRNLGNEIADYNKEEIPDAHLEDLAKLGLGLGSTGYCCRPVRSPCCKGCRSTTGVACHGRHSGTSLPTLPSERDKPTTRHP